MANGKAKGNKGERELCKWFQQWTGFPFTRVPASGGLRWKNTNATAGDIICDDERHSRRFLFSVESKSYKDINFEHLILGNKKIQILNFWNQCNEDAKRSNKEPILFMRYNGMKKNTYFVVMNYRVFNLLFPTLIKFDYNHFKVIGPNPMVIVNSEDLLKFDYLTLHKKLKRQRIHEEEENEKKLIKAKKRKRR